MNSSSPDLMTLTFFFFFFCLASVQHLLWHPGCKMQSKKDKKKKEKEKKIIQEPSTQGSKEQC